jgi:hypothetical protein
MYYYYKEKEASKEVRNILTRKQCASTRKEHGYMLRVDLGNNIL